MSTSTSGGSACREGTDDALAPGALFIESYAPRRQTLEVSPLANWLEIGPVVREAVSPLAHLSPATLQPLMTALTLLCVWAVGEGAELSVASLLAHPSIENFTVRAGQGASSYRSMLRRVAKANGVQTPAISGKLPRRSRTTAYTRAEIECIRSYATSLTNDHRRTALLSMIFLSAGCGLVGADLRTAAPAHIHHHDDVLVVGVGSRCVPMLECFVSDFSEFFTNFDRTSKTPFLGDRKTKNVTDRAAIWVAEVKGLPAFSSSALRSFFAVEHLSRGTGTIELLTLLGVKSVEALESYIDQVEVTPLACPADKPASNRAKKNSRKSGGRS